MHKRLSAGIAQLGSVSKRVACVALSVLLAVSMCGCKPTEFFVEKIIDPNAETIDTDNQNTRTINSPDAEEESAALSALDWTDESEQSAGVETLVTWSDSPNSVLPTHHSIFDMTPQFPGILASDGVSLVYDPDSSTQGNVESDGETDQEDVASSGAGESSQEADSPTESGSTNPDQTISGQDTTDESADSGSDVSDDSGTGAAGDQEGTEDGGEGENGDTPGENPGEDVTPEPEETDPDDPEGRSPDYSGYGGSARILNPSEDVLEEWPDADSVVVIGTQIAVAVQAIGGKGSIKAMSSFDYSYTAPNSTGSFESIFGSNDNEWDSDSVYIWDGGSSSGDEVDFSAVDAEEFVEELGFDAVVFYDQSLFPDEDDLTEALGDDLAKETYGYNITFYPLDFRSVDKMKESVYAIGRVLAKSDVAAQDSEAMAQEYNDLVDAVTNQLPSVVGASGVYLNIATDAATLTPVAGNGMSLGSQLVLFTDYGQEDYKPLYSWVKDAGIKLLTAGNTTESSAGPGHLAFLDPSGEVFDLEGSGTVFNRWMKITSTGKKPHNIMTADSNTTTIDRSGGLGSEDMPYLVVTGTSDGSLSNEDVRDQMRVSISSYISGKGVTLYSAMTSEEAQNAGFTSYLGTSIGKPGGQTANILTSEQLINGTVHANPNGVLGSWTEASFESVLEAVWLAALYSQSPDSISPYQPDAQWDKFSVTLSGETISGSDGMEVASSVMAAFYGRFYRTNSYTRPDLEG